MAFKENFKNGLDLVGGAISDIASILNEKNKLRAQCVRIKQIIKHDTDSRDNAYIELGKYYYRHFKGEDNVDTKDCFEIIDRMNHRIEKASLKYVQLQDAYNSLKVQSENAEKLKAALSSKAEQLKNTAQETMTDISENKNNAPADEAAAAIDISDIENAVEVINEENLTQEDPVIEIEAVITEKTEEEIPSEIELQTEEESPEVFEFDD